METLRIPKGSQLISQPNNVRDKRENAQWEDESRVTIQGSSLFSHYELYRKFRTILASTAYTFLYAVINQSHSTSNYSRTISEGNDVVLEIRIDKALNGGKNTFFACLNPANNLDSEIIKREHVDFLGMIRSCGGLTLKYPGL